MRYRQHGLWILIAVLVCSLLMAACGAPVPVAPEPPASTGDVIEKIVIEEPSSLSGEVNFITQADELFDAKALTQAVNEFMLNHPGIKVNCTIVVPVSSRIEELTAWNPELANRCTLIVWQQ